MANSMTPSRPAKPVYRQSSGFDSTPFSNGPFSRLLANLYKEGTSVPREIEILEMHNGHFPKDDASLRPVSQARMEALPALKPA